MAWPLLLAKPTTNKPARMLIIPITTNSSISVKPLLLVEAEELKDAVGLLEEAENCKTKEEVKKNGIARSLQQLAEKLGDEDSKLHKTVEGIKNGIGIAQDIAKGYNDVAQWLGLPQVPKPFLKKD